MFKAKHINVTWEQLFEIYSASKQLRRVIEKDSWELSRVFSKKVASCTNIANYAASSTDSIVDVPVYKDNVQNIINVMATYDKNHSGHYYYPIKAVREYSLNPNKTAASAAERDYLRQLGNGILWDDEQGKLRKEFVAFLEKLSFKLLQKMADVYTLKNHVDNPPKDYIYKFMVHNYDSNGKEVESLTMYISAADLV